MVDKRKFTKKDEDYLASYIKEEREYRKNSDHRKNHEKIWKVLDAQIAMEAPYASSKTGNKEDWHNSVQLGDLADALEVLAADTLRLVFPNDRWQRPHIELKSQLEVETGKPEKIDLKEQKKRDFVLRALMNQQHIDFGFKDRIKEAIKEALAHGGFVLEANWETIELFEGGVDSEILGAAAPKLYSMHNCFPDPSPSANSKGLFYRGSMIIETSMPYSQVMRQKKWINLKDVKKEDQNSKDPDVRITTYYGDLTIPRSKGKDMYLPNKKIVLANDKFVYQETNATPYLPIIYAGYEKDDLRDPYFTSPLIKRSPMHTIATRSANKMLDAVDLKTEPCIAYDALDPEFAKNGGVGVAPAKEIPTRGSAKVQVIDTADPTWAFNALQFAQRHVQDGTGVDATRKGVTASTEQTAFEVAKKDQKSEIRTVDFVGTLERQCLLPFLYMQHDLNKRKLDNYPFFNTEVSTPDFLRASKEDIPPKVRFEIVGSKEVLGEEQRAMRYSQAVNAAAALPQIAQQTDWSEVAEENWKMSGMKDPQRFILQSDNPQLEQLKQAAEQQIKQLQEQVQELTIKQQVHDLKIAEKDSQLNSLKQELSTFEERDQARRELEALEDSLLKEKERINNEIQKFQDSIRDSQTTFKQAIGNLPPDQYNAVLGEADQIDISLENLINDITGLQDPTPNIV